MDDYASMLAELEQQLDGRTLSLLLGAGDAELAAIRAGRAPTPDEAARLRLAHAVSHDASLGEPRAALSALADAQALASITRTRLLGRGRFDLALAPFLASPA